MIQKKNLLLMYGRFAPSKEHLHRLKTLFPEAAITNAQTEEQAYKAANSCHAIIGHRFLKQTLSSCPNIEWIQSFAGGIDNIASNDLIRSSATVTCCPIFSEMIAIHGISLAWALQRRLTHSLELQHKGKWAEPDFFLPMPQNALILGMGEIGMHLAQLLKCMGLKVIGVATSHSAAKRRNCDRLYTNLDWKNELPNCDMCFLALPALTGTYKIFDEQAIAALPRNAIVVNLGRGEVIDEQALFSAVAENKIAGAGLDVLEKVPDEHSPIWRLKDLIITRKTSTLFAGRQQQLEAFIENQVALYLSGKPLQYRVSKETLAASIKGNQ